MQLIPCDKYQWCNAPLPVKPVELCSNTPRSGSGSGLGLGLGLGLGPGAVGCVGVLAWAVVHCGCFSGALCTSLVRHEAPMCASSYFMLIHSKGIDHNR